MTRTSSLLRTLTLVSALTLGVSALPLMPVAHAAEPAAATTAANPVIAKVDGKDITLNDAKAYIKTLPEQVQAAPFEQVFPMVQEQMVIGQIISAKAAKENFENDPEVQTRLAALKDNVIRGSYVEREMKKRLTDDVLKKEYNTMIKDFKAEDEVHAQHVLVADEAKAKEVIAKLDKGAKFADLVKEYSTDKGAGVDGDLGFFKKGDMVKEFSDAAFAMKKGQHSKVPVKSAFGYHVINVLDTRKSKAPTFEELKPQIAQKMQQTMVQTLLKEYRDSAKVEVFTETGAPLPAATETKK